jgi:hypothetical protein
MCRVNDLVSVVIPWLNPGMYHSEQLAALSRQDYGGALGGSAGGQ